MRLIRRLSRFASVGAIATVVHYLLLGLLMAINLEIWIGNLIAFALAFALSFSWQQRYTFKDRLGRNTRLNEKAGALLFIMNLIFAGALARLVGKNFSFILPLLPAIINYGAFYAFTGMKFFKARY